MRLTGSEQPLLCIAFSPEAAYVAAGGHDGKVRVWNITGELVWTLEGHLDHVHGAAFSPSGYEIYSASKDGTVRLWDLHSAKKH